MAVLLIALAAAGASIYPEPLIPPDNPVNPAKVALGARLFNETRLSVTGAYSCASCHQPERHFTDGRRTAIGATGEPHSRNTPTLYNVAFNASYGWDDAGVTTLEQQHVIPLTGAAPLEMGYDPQLLTALRDDASYTEAFKAAFGAPEITTPTVIMAIATYVRGLRAPRSAFDRYLFDDDRNALSPSARAGMALFFSSRTGCSACHASLSFSGPVRHRIQQADAVFHVTGVSDSDKAFRAPTLRQVAQTAPYMHDGSLPTLRAVLDHYQRTRAERVPRFTLNGEEADALIAFLQSL